MGVIIAKLESSYKHRAPQTSTRRDRCDGTHYHSRLWCMRQRHGTVEPRSDRVGDGRLSTVSRSHDARCGTGWFHEEYSVLSGDDVTEGGDGHSAGGSIPAAVKEERMSSSLGLSAGSFLPHSSTISQTGSGIGDHRGRLGLFPLMV